MPYYLKIQKLRGYPNMAQPPPADRSPPHPCAMGHLRHGRDRIRVRHLRLAGIAADRAAGPDGDRQGEAGHAGLQSLGGPAVLHPGGGGRHLRPAGRLSDRPPGPPPRAGVEHPALRVLGAGFGTGHLCAARCWCCAAPPSSASPWSSWRPWHGWPSCSPTQAARSRAGLYAGVLVDRRIADQRRLLRRGDVLEIAAGHPRRARSVALYADLRRDPGHSADPHPAVPAGVARLAGEEAGRHAQAAQLRRTVPARSIARSRC